jgi:hypothetical protein
LLKRQLTPQELRSCFLCDEKCSVGDVARE